MDVDLKLPAVEFKEAPTTTQMVNMLRDTAKFLSTCGGALLASQQYNIGDHAVGALFNGTIQLKQAADFFEKGPNSAGLAVPQR